VVRLIALFKMGDVDSFKFPDAVAVSSAIVAVAIEYFKNFHLFRFATDETYDGPSHLVLLDPMANAHWNTPEVRTLSRLILSRFNVDLSTCF